MSQEKYKSLDDIVFENRNKSYGAYDLRKSERSTLLRALIIGVTLIGFVTLGIYLYNVVLSKADKVDTVVDINLTDVDIPEEIIEEEIKPDEPEPEPEPEPEIAEVRVVIPEPKKDVVKEEPIVKVEEMENKLIGLKNVEGEASTSTKGRSEPERPKPGTGEGTKPAPPSNVNYSVRNVKDMAVFPGCEKFAGDKNKLQQCLSQKLNDELNDQLADFAEVMNNRGETSAVAKISFVIDKSGKIIQVQAMQGGGGYINEQLGKEAEKAMQRIATRLASRGRLIQPAKLDDGSPVNLNFSIPVRFNLQ
ncbi:MAG TPA: hypothetical protein VL021_10570 [Brumimicrobium sp.]|nr:hypothetical protein [Brumimicrobium sp.]